MTKKLSKRITLVAAGFVEIKNIKVYIENSESVAMEDIK